MMGLKLVTMSSAAVLTMTITAVFLLSKEATAFQCTNFSRTFESCNATRDLPPLELLCLGHCYTCNNEGGLRHRRQVPGVVPGLGLPNVVPVPVQGLPDVLRPGEIGVPRGTPFPGDVGPLSLTVLQRCLFQCVASLNLLGQCNANLIVTELLSVCPHVNLEVCCLSACQCCNDDQESVDKCFDVCLGLKVPLGK